jgi:RsiW-degrading membrane proteinase PrsW (M82 family)
MKQTTALYGILAGFATIAYAFLIYSTQKAGFFTMWFYISSLLLYALAMYFAAKQAYNEDFKVVLRTAFLVFLIANALYYVFDFVLFKKIDPSLASFQAEAAIAYLKPNTPLEEQIKMEENIRSSDIHDVASLVKQYVKSLIGGFGLSVAVAYIIKRK